MSDDIVEENTALWVRNANQAETIARLRDESDGQFRRIAELEAELEASQECELDVNRAMRKRLAAVVKLCDAIQGESWLLDERDVRAAATGDTT